MKKIYFLFLAFFFNLTINAQCGDYSQLLTAGFTKIDFFDGQHGFAFGMGTMIITHDGGENWQFVELPGVLKYNSAMKGCEILDENTAIIYGSGASYMDHTFIKTIDKGQTWNPIALPFEKGDINIDFVDENTGFMAIGQYSLVGNSDVFYKTVDGGETWNVVSSNLNSVIDNIGLNKAPGLKFIDEQFGFIWGHDNMFKTQDGGVTWQPISNPAGEEVNNIKVSENGTLVAAFNSNTYSYYISVNSGDTWTEITELSYNSGDQAYANTGAFDINDDKVYTMGVSSDDDHLLIFDLVNGLLTLRDLNIDTDFYEADDISVANDGIAFVIESSNSSDYGRKIIRTQDDGLNWEELDSYKILNTFSELNLYQNSQEVFTIGRRDDDFFIFTSQDNGATWQKKLQTPDINISILKANNNYISYIGYAYVEPNFHLALHESSDLGETWTDTNFVEPSITAGYPIFAQLDDENTFIANDHYIMLLSTDKGQSWDSVTLPEGIEYFDVDARALNEVYLYGFSEIDSQTINRYIYKSTDGMQSWIQVFDMIVSGNSYMDLGIDKAIAGNSNDVYLVDLDNNTYQQISVTPPFTNGYQISLLNDNVWLSREFSNIYLSYDHGQTWQQRSCEVCGQKVVINPENEILTYNDQGIERFEAYIPYIPDLLGNTTVEFNSHENYYSTYDNYAEVEWVLMSGGTMTEEGGFVTVNWTQSGEHTIKVRYINECGVSEYAELIVTVEEDNTNVVGELIMPNISVSPNPFHSNINIALNNFDGGFSSVKIISITGQVIYESKEQGNSFTVGGLNNLSEGVYFLIIDKENKRHIKKIVKSN